MKSLLQQYPLVLMEASIVEQLRRSDKVTLHPLLANAMVMYDPQGGLVLSDLYRRYTSIAAEASLPILLCSPTWRANRDRLAEAGVRKDVNSDAVAYMKSIRESLPGGGPEVLIGGMIGCKNDCYLPEEGLETDVAEAFHAWQIERLAAAEPDYLLAATLPALPEAIGIAKAMAVTGLPYIISFVINRKGQMMDGTSLEEAISTIDASVATPPLGYSVNCAYPTFLCAGQQPATVFERLIGYQANASSLDQCDLENAPALHQDDLIDWGQEMLALNETYGVNALGGCCGTGTDHLKWLVDNRRVTPLVP